MADNTIGEAVDDRVKVESGDKAFHRCVLKANVKCVLLNYSTTTIIFMLP
jgi:hypothetical protein